MPEIRILIGLPGTGKSTYRKNLLAAEPDWIVASTDDMVDAYAAREGLTYSQAFDKMDHKKLGKEYKRRLKEALELGKNVIVDRTNMTAKGRQEILEMIPSGYVRTAVVFEIDDDEHKHRLSTRAEKTGKVIPDFVIKNMAKSYVAPEPEDYNDIIVIKD